MARLLIEYKGPTTADPYCPKAGFWVHVEEDGTITRYNVAVYQTHNEARWRKARFDAIGAHAFQEPYVEVR